MSCNNWEAGTIKFSVAEWPRFKKAFREGFNSLQNAELAAATRHWNRYKTGKLPRWHKVGFTGKKYGDSHDQNRAVVDFDEEKRRFHRLWETWKLSTATPEAIAKKFGSWAPRSRPRKPLRKDYPLATNKQIDFCVDEGNIHFDNKTREVTYESGNNNHAVETARDSEVGGLFFSLLNRVTWTRGTGGTLQGNDEYNQDSREDGGGGNYVTLRCGPKEVITRSGRNRMRGTVPSQAARRATGSLGSPPSGGWS